MKKSLILGFLIGAMALSAYSQPNSIRQRIFGQLPDESVADLRSDSVPWNAICAHDAIYYFASDEFLYNAKLIAALEKSLDSDDWQQRQMAGDILRDLMKSEKYRPKGDLSQSQLFQRLIAVSIEGLRDDALPNLFQGGCVGVYNASRGIAFLLDYPEFGTELLEKALESDNAQQQFLAAVILGSTGGAGKIERIAQILIPHLQNDSIEKNACMAAYALYHLGNGVIPFLIPYKEHSDNQMRETAQFILRDLESPLVAKEEQWKHRHLQQLTRYRSDPAMNRCWDDIPHQWNQSLFLSREELNHK